MAPRATFLALLLTLTLLCSDATAISSRGSPRKRALNSLRKRECSAPPAPAPTTDAPTSTAQPEPAPEPTATQAPAPPPGPERSAPWNTLNFPLPKKLYVQEEPKEMGLQVLQRTLSGLASLGTLDNADVPMIWINTKGLGDTRTRQRFLNRTKVPAEDFDPDVFKLVSVYKDLGVVKGYIPYHFKEEGDDLSLNIATSLAAHFGGVVVEEGLEQQAKDLGLTMLKDARGMSYDDVMALNLPFNKEVTTLLNNIHANRDMAVAAKTLVTIDKPDAGYFKGLDNIATGGTVIGYPSSEHDGVMTASERGGKGLVASDWMSNWNVMSSGPVPKLPNFRENHKTYVDDGESHYVAFILTDGDNFAWTAGDGTSGQAWWNNTHRGEMPFTWGLPMSTMAQTAPDVLSFWKDTATENDAFINYCDAYAFVEVIHDKAGSDGLTEFFKRRQPWSHDADLDVAAVFTDAWDTPSAQAAYDDIAKASPDLNAVLSIQYGPYAAGQGKFMYGARDDGSKLPILSAKMTIWNAGPTDFLGDPNHVADVLNQWASDKSPGKPLQDRIATVLIHAWSTWQAPDDVRDIARPDGQIGGYTGGMWAARKLNQDQKVVTMWDIEDMLKAIR
ncbi:hypothetical protein EXIGLDRAFT_846403 [Exidia glandulosa HHB12029]|uniref:Uncharacterized protein n=1 Tax=Exidia glandulosa HHB12029 TaxID=1314781 RepID=A0A165AZT3_EXIGL|nr:hypothetical protein EXIGLDRAFT_846403 [Exidia glandulosa HHB12029]